MDGDNGVYSVGAGDQLGELYLGKPDTRVSQNATSCNTSFQRRVARRRTFATDSGWSGWGTVGGTIGGRSFILVTDGRWLAAATVTGQSKLWYKETSRDLKRYLLL